MSYYGIFNGKIITYWLTDDNPNRNMQLLESFSYTGPDKKNWDAPKDSIINGASIPQAFWSVVGSPYTGNYRGASVIHDVACVYAKTNEDRKKADKMFYYACLAGGCPANQARVFYVAVRIGAWADRVMGSSSKSTFDESFFNPGLPTAEAKNDYLLSRLKDIGSAVYDYPDDSTPEALDLVIDSKLPLNVNLASE